MTMGALGVDTITCSQCLHLWRRGSWILMHKMLSPIFVNKINSTEHILYASTHKIRDFLIKPYSINLHKPVSPNWEFADVKNTHTWYNTAMQKSTMYHFNCQFSRHISQLLTQMSRRQHCWWSAWQNRQIMQTLHKFYALGYEKNGEWCEYWFYLSFWVNTYNFIQIRWFSDFKKRKERLCADLQYHRAMFRVLQILKQQGHKKVTQKAAKLFMTVLPGQKATDK